MSLSYKIMRRWHVFKKKLGAKLTGGLTPSSVRNPEQAKALEIAKRIITDEESELYYSNDGFSSRETSSRYLIRKGHLVIKMTHDKMRIINGKYKYDVAFRYEDRDFVNIKRIFSRSLAHRLDKLEAMVNEKVEKSLSHILIELKNDEQT